MKPLKALFSLLLIMGAIYYCFYALMPQKMVLKDAPETQFSAERALIPLKEITKAPHFIGSKESENVRQLLIKELKKLGLEPQRQEGYVLNEKWGSFDKPINIVAKLKGSSAGKSLLIFSHYDSALVPSFGASDAGSGVVTILESLRAYLASGKTPKNDIIVLFTDGEEVGLDGAKLFVREHPWAKNVGIALNFEARGSGGPSNMIVETNQGNKNLIKQFNAANPQFPVASSLMYSIYKMLPNDTDSTVLREEGDIDGLFFAFIDDHFDYHTANDNFERLDRNTLQHQGSYLLPLIHHFADANLDALKSDEDYVYVNYPILKMVSYPFSWVIPLWGFAVLLFLILIGYGLKNKALNGRLSLKGFVIFTLVLTAVGLIGYFGWQALLKIYPHYNEIQHGFTYNGHSYIAFFVAVSLALTFYFYYKWAKNNTPTNLLVAPLFYWLLINGGIAFYLPGGGFFIIPVLFTLLALFVLIRQQTPKLLLLLLLCLPAIATLAPLIQFFPVGLGLKMLFISCVFTVLLFGLLLPIVGFYPFKKILSISFLVVALALFLKAHWANAWSESQQKPNSLLFYQDTETQKAYWVTYDKSLDEWTKIYLGENPEKASNYIENAAGSKYNINYTFAKETAPKPLPLFTTKVYQDTLINNLRAVNFTIYPKREVNVLRLYLDKASYFKELSLNGKAISKDSLGNVYAQRKSNGLLNYYLGDRDTLNISYKAPIDVNINFSVLEYSFNLLNHPLFNIEERPKYTMTKPFVFNDAIVVKREININELKSKPLDTLTIDAQ